MSKTIYDEALLKLKEIAERLTRKQWIELTNNIELIRSNLQQAQKQEKLLELYKRLNSLYKKLYTMELSMLSLNSNYYEIEIIKLEQQIKELEK